MRDAGWHIVLASRLIRPFTTAHPCASASRMSADDFFRGFGGEQRLAEFGISQNPAESREHGEMLRDGRRDEQEKKPRRAHCQSRRKPRRSACRPKTMMGWSTSPTRALRACGNATPSPMPVLWSRSRSRKARSSVARASGRSAISLIWPTSSASTSSRVWPVKIQFDGVGRK